MAKKISKRIQQVDILTDSYFSDSKAGDNQPLQDGVLNYSSRSDSATLYFQSCSPKLSTAFDDAKNASQDCLPQSGATAADENKFSNNSLKSGSIKSNSAFTNENAFP